MDRNFALEFVRVGDGTARQLMGRGDEKAADQAAVDARSNLDSIEFSGTVVIGEGERIGTHAIYRESRSKCPNLDIAWILWREQLFAPSGSLTVYR